MRSFLVALSFFRPEDRRRLPILAACALFLSVLEAAGLALIFPVLLSLLDPAAAANEFVTRLFMRLGLETSTSVAAVGGVVIVVLFLTKNVLAIAILRWQYLFLAKAEVSIGDDILRRHFSTDYMIMARRNSSELTRNTMSCSGNMVGLMIVPMVTFLTEGLLIIAGLTILMMADVQAAVTATVLVGAGSVMIYLMSRRRLGATGEAVQHFSFQLLNSLKQIYGASKELRLMHRQNYMIELANKQRAGRARAGATQSFWQNSSRHLQEISLILGSTGVVVVMALTRSPSEMIAVLVLFGSAAFRLSSSVNRLVVAAQQMKTGQAVLRILVEDRQVSQEAPLSKSAPASVVADSSVPEAERADVVRFDHVGFSYPYAERSAVSEISFRLPRGGSLGIVGASGAGKSTLVDLLLGLISPTEGRILIDGREVASSLEEWQRHIGYVPQFIYLTDDTLRRNVGFALPDEEIDDDRVWEALRLAHLEDYVRQNMPQGLDTVLGENGASLSGGQRQRVGIARALYHNPDVLVFDEATSALDTGTESHIVGVIDALKGQKTVVLVAHRLSTVATCDNLLLLDAGRLCGVGSMQELIKTNPFFAKIAAQGGVRREDRV